MAKTTRDQYVMVTYEMIRSAGLEEVSVRKIVAKLGCTPGALYRHFESLEYLETLACLRFLQEYNQKLKELAQTRMTVEHNLRAWRIFIDCAFRLPAVYYALFYGVYAKELDRAVRDYCEIFQDYYEELNIAQVSVVLSHSIEDRDMMGMEDSIGRELPDRETAQFLARMDNSIFRSHLLAAVEAKDSLRSAQIGEECYHLIEELVQRMTAG